MNEYALKACERIEHIAIIIGAIKSCPEIYHGAVPLVKHVHHHCIHIIRRVRGVQQEVIVHVEAQP